MKATVTFLLLLLKNNLLAQSFFLSYSPKGIKPIETLFTLQSQKVYLISKNDGKNLGHHYSLRGPNDCVIKHIKDNQFEIYVPEGIDSTRLFILKNGKIVDSMKIASQFYIFDFYLNNPNEYKRRIFPNILGLVCRSTPWGESFAVDSFQIAIYDSAQKIKMTCFSKRKSIDKATAGKIKLTYDKYDYLVFENIFLKGSSGRRFFLKRYIYMRPGYLNYNSSVFKESLVRGIVNDWKYSSIK